MSTENTGSGDQGPVATDRERAEADLLNRHVCMDVLGAEAHLRLYLRRQPEAGRIREIDELLSAALERMEAVIQAVYPSIRFFRQDFAATTDEHGNAAIEIRPGDPAP